jgi:two-component system cell cycle sensor histidine kinase/response regulator CckA
LEGLAIAEANDRAIDVVVTDVVMPEMGGRQMVEHLRRLRPELRVLYISGYADDASARRELAAGEEALLEKPFTARRLREAVLSAANN